MRVLTHLKGAKQFDDACETALRIFVGSLLSRDNHPPGLLCKLDKREWRADSA
jgi:hypothetical protein